MGRLHAPGPAAVSWNGGLEWKRQGVRERTPSTVERCWNGLEWAGMDCLGLYYVPDSPVSCLSEVENTRSALWRDVSCTSARSGRERGLQSLQKFEGTTLPP